MLREERDRGLVSIAEQNAEGMADRRHRAAACGGACVSEIAADDRRVVASSVSMLSLQEELEKCFASSSSSSTKSLSLGFAANGSAGGCRQVSGQFCAHRASRSWCAIPASSIRNLRNNRRALRHEACVLALERLGYTAAPALRNGLGSGVGEDILFVSLQPIEDSLRH